MPSATLPPPGPVSELARVWRRYEGDPDAAIRAITETAARALGVARASVWLLDEAAAGLLCVDRYDAAARRHTSGDVLRAFDFPAYFGAMLEEDALVAADAHADPRTAELAAPYLGPLGIGARLDAPIRTGRRLVGVLCHEHVGPPRTWTAVERRDAVFLATLMSLTLELKSRARCEALLAATIESAGEGILATDDTRVVAFNQRFVEMWRMDGATLRSLEAVTRHIAARTRRGALVFGGGAGDAIDTLELDDGRVFELSSRPQLAADRVVGRVWSFRDVTAQRRRTT
ncbi:MAG TPA: GAF domain-containing protein [Kofleriaceae bacterium]|nr:GAF domain-containing protein [Kofleriaceae bacterium]